MLACLCLVLLAAAANAEIGCILGSSESYSGEKSTTLEGRTCQRWDAKGPHEVRHVPRDGGKHNFCRNPDGDIRGTWCYTTDPDLEWEYCDIPKCPSEAMIKWNVVNEATAVSSIASVKADIELMNQIRDDSKPPQQGEYPSWDNSQFKAFDADYERERLYFTDVKGNYFGIYNIQTQEVEKRLQGKAEHIEAISYDWVSDNFYWTDSKLRSVMVADHSLQSYAIVYTPKDSTPLALEVHSVERRLYFSTYLRQSYGGVTSKIVSTDLSGKGFKVIYEDSELGKIVALTIDYNENRLYWAEDLGDGLGSRISSIDLGSGEKVEHYADEERRHFDLAVYSDYIYVSDNAKRYTFANTLQFHVQVIGKKSKKVSHYVVKDKPMGIATYDKNEFRSAPKPKGPGECSAKPACEEICLPTLKGKRRCTCSLGYHLQPKTNKCVAKLVEDEFLLVVDSNEGHAYQIPFASPADSSIAPLGKSDQIKSAAVNPSTKLAYFADGESNSISEGILNDDRSKPIIDSLATQIEIDPISGNLFFTDSKSITLSTPDGTLQRKIVKSSDENTDIKAFALDLKNKHLYWTDTRSKDGSGQLLRCRFDGSGSEVVLDNLDRPYGVAIDFETYRLYLVESQKALVYEMSLMKLRKVKSNSASDYKNFDLSASVKDDSLLTTLKVHNGFTYIVDKSQAQLQKFNLKKRTLTGFGPATFYNAAGMCVYSKSAYENLKGSVSNPCAKLRYNCSLCVDLNRQRAKCLGPKAKKN